MATQLDNLDSEARLLIQGAPSQSKNLERMRLLLQSRRQTPSLDTGPVNSIGEGISQAATNLTQMMIQNRQQRQLDALLAQEKQDTTDAYNQKVESLRPLEGYTGLKAETLINMDSSSLNTMLADGLKESNILQKAQALQEQFGQTPVAVQSPEFTNLDMSGYNLPDNTANLIARDDDAFKKMSTVAANPEALKALLPHLAQQDLNTAQGVNNTSILTNGLMTGSPTTNYQMDQQAQNAYNLALANDLLEQRAPIQIAQDKANVFGTVASTANTQANTAHTNLTNQAFPALTNLQLRLGGQTGDLNGLNIGRQNGQLELMRNLLNDPSLLTDPTKAPLTATLGQYYSGTGNPIQGGLSAISTIQNPKPGKPLTGAMTQMGASFPKSGVPAGLASLQAGGAPPAIPQKPALKPAPKPTLPKSIAPKLPQTWQGKPVIYQNGNAIIGEGHKVGNQIRYNRDQYVHMDKFNRMTRYEALKAKSLTNPNSFTQAERDELFSGAREFSPTSIKRR